jgi:hypothetical protein
MISVIGIGKVSLQFKKSFAYKTNNAIWDYIGAVKSHKESEPSVLEMIMLQ